MLGIVVLTLGGPIAALVREGLFFGLPYLLIALILSVTENLIPPMWAWVGAGVNMVLASTAFVFSARFRGDLELAEKIRQKQNTEGPAEDICSGIYPLADSTDFAVASVVSMIQNHGYLLIYPFALLLVLVPFPAFWFSRTALLLLLAAGLALVPLPYWALTGVDGFSFSRRLPRCWLRALRQRKKSIWQLRFCQLGLEGQRTHLHLQSR